jgi:integrase
MGVYKQKGGLYRIQFTLNGKTYVKSAKTANKKSAELMEAKWRTELHGKEYLNDKEEITIQQLIDDYMKLPLAKSSIRNAIYAFKSMGEHMDFNVNASEFDQKQILKYVQTRLREGKKESSIRVQVLCLSGAWNDGNRDIYNIPNLTIPTLKQSPIKLNYFSDTDEEQLFEHLRTRSERGNAVEMLKDEMHDVFVVLLDTGMRNNELCRLEWSKVDLKEKTIEIWRAKTSTPSFLRMSNRLHQVLQRRSEYVLHSKAKRPNERQRHEKWVFPNFDFTNHRSLDTSHLNSVIKAAGLPHSVHIMRHTFASRLLKAGMTLFEVKELLGHKSIMSTMRYSHLEKNITSAKAVDILNARQVDQNRSRMKAVG